MVKRLIKEAIKKSAVKEVLPSFVNAKLVLDELEEHGGFIRWGAKRIILPLAIFYILIGLVFGEHVLGSLLMGLVVFLYSNFLPDLDTFFPHNDNKKNEVSAVKKRIALFFAPAVVYYILSRKLTHWDLGKDKPFHNSRALLEFSAFLFFFGLLLYFSALKALFFMVFGFCGYFMHLTIDNRVSVIKIGKGQFEDF